MLYADEEERARERERLVATFQDRMLAKAGDALGPGDEDEGEGEDGGWRGPSAAPRRDLAPVAARDLRGRPSCMDVTGLAYEGSEPCGDGVSEARFSSPCASLRLRLPARDARRLGAGSASAEASVVAFVRYTEGP